MSRIRLVTDSTADIPQPLLERLNITMVPLKIHFGDEAYLDGVTLRSDQFYEKLTASATLPTTSQPSPLEFLDTYKKIIEEEGPDVQIVSVHLSSALSGTYQSAVLAKSMLEGEEQVTVVDSKSASYGIGALVVAAAEAAKDGAGLDTCLELIRRMREQFHIYFLVDTLEFLKKGGRIGKASAILGALLNIKPILSIDKDGEVAAVDRIRGHKKAMSRMVEMLEADLSGVPIQLHIAHANHPEAAAELEALIRERIPVDKVSYVTLGPVIGAHTGPGVVAAFVCPVEV
ncbi:DegV family protein [Paenibacillus chartarius]|uniref:DegV family protein n=1 Tax=Paenibacillus chartarius TaxID=747481 RepID=A0ABV6DU86_9BACL